jgi:hypothetical protein
VAILIPLAGIVLGAIGLKKSRTQRDKVLSGIALGVGVAWVVGGGVIALTLSGLGGAHFVKQAPLEAALTPQTATGLAASGASNVDKIAQFRCSGPANCRPDLGGGVSVSDRWESPPGVNTAP